VGTQGKRLGRGEKSWMNMSQPLGLIIINSEIFDI
jgi:hypothetical protein